MKLLPQYTATTEWWYKYYKAAVNVANILRTDLMVPPTILEKCYKLKK